MALLAPVGTNALPWLLTCATRVAQGIRQTDWEAVRQVQPAATGAEAHIDQILPYLRTDQFSERDRELCRVLLEFTESRLTDSEQSIYDEYQPGFGRDDDAVARKELDELHEGEWYQQQRRRIHELDRVIGDKDH
jgi:hypothetical protein